MTSGSQENGDGASAAERDDRRELAAASGGGSGSFRSLHLYGVGGPFHGITANGRFSGPFAVDTTDLFELAEERNRPALAALLEKAADRMENGNNPAKESATGAASLPQSDQKGDVESAPDTSRTISHLRSLARRIRTAEKAGPFTHGSMEEMAAEADAEAAASALAAIVLRASPELGIASDDEILEARRSVFGTNALTEKKLDSFLKLCWEALQDFVLIMLIALGIVSIVIETTIGLEEDEECGACWIEGAAILMSVCIVVLVTAGIDYAKQFAFVRLTKSLDQTNTKSVIRDGRQINVVDADIVVGDILSVNSHNLASIPADCVLLGPSSATELKMDESTLTGESVLISKRPGDVILSGTNANQGTGKMVVIGVGLNSVAGRIKARVYETDEHDGDELGGDEESPLFAKLTKIAKQIGMAGTVAAFAAFAASCAIGLGYKREPVSEIVEYFIVAVTVLAVAVPEGLPLAVTLALAFSSNKMMKEQNLVKHLDACETMGCATTICTDKTGTLTANKMTARAFYLSGENNLCSDPSITLGRFLLDSSKRPSNETIDLIVNLISVNTMNETVLDFSADGSRVVGSSGNPTEVALLTLVHDLGSNYQSVRRTTRGRADVGELAEFLNEGKQFSFSSARKMMSWAVPLETGGYRIYTKGAAEVIVGRCTLQLSDSVSGEVRTASLDDADRSAILEVGEAYARRGMRNLALAYRDLSIGTDFEKQSEEVKNSDGSAANEVETDLVFVGLVGIEDPLRPEVPEAIRKCYEAGIDVRLVTGDSPNTAVSIAYQAGILRPSHFTHHDEDQYNDEEAADDSTREMVAANLKPNVLMEGKVFRGSVYRTSDDGTREFDQAAFDRIWPHLRVLARSSPDDKLTLAHGLNQSTLFSDKEVVRKLKAESKITVFPDRQVIAMTGDGTNDAPALKRADIGFAMGISGTQIAKDAADIILLDDNFASIVTAARWGRNVYASIQKFLQFQLTVNMSAVVTALVGAFVYQKSPLAAIQLLWVNLLMDSLASLALASEPPTEELLKVPPVNRSEHMITPRMWANMIGQASYQIAVTMVLLFRGPDLLDIDPGHKVEKDDGLFPGHKGANSVHYTLIFNVFVWMQLFNEVNARNLHGELNVFKGVFRNPLFVSILVITGALQIVMVQVGDVAMHVHVDGLNWKMWLISLGLGFGSLPWQQVINLLVLFGQSYKSWRDDKRLRKNARMTTRRATSGGDKRD